MTHKIVTDEFRRFYIDIEGNETVLRCKDEKCVKVSHTKVCSIVDGETLLQLLIEAQEHLQEEHKE